MVEFVVFKILSDSTYSHGNFTRAVADIWTGLWNKKRQHSSSQDFIKLERKYTEYFNTLDDILINNHL